MQFARPRRRTAALFSIAALFLAPIGMRAVSYTVSDAPRAYYQADWSSTGLLPAARDDKPARVLVFTGTTGAWKGIFSVHSWIVIKPANAEDWDTEYLDAILSVAVVDGPDVALDHIARHSSGHTDAIIAEDAAVDVIFVL